MKYAIGSDERTHLTDCVIAKLEASGAELRLYGAFNLDENPNWPHVAKRWLSRCPRDDVSRAFSSAGPGRA